MRLASWSYSAEFLVYVPDPQVDLVNFYDNQEWLLQTISLSNSTIQTQRAGNFSAVLLRLGQRSLLPLHVFFCQPPSLAPKSQTSDGSPSITSSISSSQSQRFFCSRSQRPLKNDYPNVKVTVTSLFGMFAPVPYGQKRESRFQLGMVTLLPMGVLMLTIVDDLPKFAQSATAGPRGSFSGVPLLGIFYLCLILTVAACTNTYSLLVRLEKRCFEGQPIPRLLLSFLPRRPPTKPPVYQLSLNGTATNGSLPYRIALPDGPGIFKDDRETKEEEAAATKEDWERLLLRLETIAFYFYLFLISIFLLGFFFPFWR